MKILTSISLCFLALLSAPFHSSAQGFEAPSDSNAVIYFARVTNYAEHTYFDFFHETQLIGSFNGANFMRYECREGGNLFWASSENKQFLNCDLKAGGTYIVLVNIAMGFWKSHLVLEPITPENEDFQRVISFIKNNYPLRMSQEKIAKIQDKLEDKKFISHNLEKYESEWFDSEMTKIISPHMAIPNSYLE